MDVFLQGEWFEFRFPKGKILGLKLKPASYEEQIEWGKGSQESFYGCVTEHIIDWRGLTKNGNEVEPTSENVKTYMSYFLLAKVERIGANLGPAEVKETGPVEDEEKPEQKTLGVHLVEILQNIENFLGN
jgi:hypothetical protein